MTIKQHKYSTEKFGFSFFSSDFIIGYYHAKDVQVGDTILFNHSKFGSFVVDNIESRYIDYLSAEIKNACELDESLIKQEYNKYEFINEDNGGSNVISITDIPYNAVFLIIRKK
jgi:hypothetical protein